MYVNLLYVYLHVNLAHVTDILACLSAWLSVLSRYDQLLSWRRGYLLSKGMDEEAVNQILVRLSEPIELAAESEEAGLEQTEDSYPKKRKRYSSNLLPVPPPSGSSFLFLLLPVPPPSCRSSFTLSLHSVV